MEFNPKLPPVSLRSLDANGITRSYRPLLNDARVPPRPARPTLLVNPLEDPILEIRRNGVARRYRLDQLKAWPLLASNLEHSVRDHLPPIDPAEGEVLAYSAWEYGVALFLQKVDSLQRINANSSFQPTVDFRVLHSVALQAVCCYKGLWNAPFRYAATGDTNLENAAVRWLRHESCQSKQMVLKTTLNETW